MGEEWQAKAQEQEQELEEGGEEKKTRQLGTHFQKSPNTEPVYGTNVLYIGPVYGTNVLYIVPVYGIYARALTFENLWQHFFVGNAARNVARYSSGCQKRPD